MPGSPFPIRIHGEEEVRLDHIARPGEERGEMRERERKKKWIQGQISLALKSILCRSPRCQIHVRTTTPGSIFFYCFYCFLWHMSPPKASMTQCQAQSWETDIASPPHCSFCSLRNVKSFSQDQLLPGTKWRRIIQHTAVISVALAGWMQNPSPLEQARLCSICSCSLIFALVTMTT